MKHTFELIGGLIILSFIGFVLWQMVGLSSDSKESVVCTSEAKLCPDGSSVGRTGPDCEFAACPGEDLTARTAEFKFALEEVVRNEIGQPIEGFEPQMFMQVFPGLQPEDFNDVDAEIGVYKYRDGELKHEIPQDVLVHSAAPAVTEVGTHTLLRNIIHRLKLNPEITTVSETVALLKLDRNPASPEPEVDLTGPMFYPTIARYGEDMTNIEEYRADCADKGGTFNECSSPCDNSTDPDISCAAVCSMICVGTVAEPVACTMDAKQCPDGSYVGRIAPNCEFAECPETLPVDCPDIMPKKCWDGSHTRIEIEGQTCKYIDCPPEGGPVSNCTLDTMQCPDGSWVNRTAPHCEFEACPASGSPIRYGEDTSRMEEYRSDCEQRGGVFDECSSPCDNSTDPDISCAAVCSMICEGPASEHVPTDEVTECTPESKLAEMCTMEYAPVCGLVEVQCVTTPCNPVPETFGNACGACAQGNVISYTEGECSS